jgi:ABC-type transport system involved in cytochrome bd biosynthesis fused ATPase/permease subunit
MLEEDRTSISQRQKYLDYLIYKGQGHLAEDWIMNQQDLLLRFERSEENITAMRQDADLIRKEINQIEEDEKTRESRLELLERKIQKIRFGGSAPDHKGEDTRRMATSLLLVALCAAAALFAG